MVIESTVYSCTYFKEINSDGSFQVSEHCQYDLLYRLLHSELSLYQRVSMFPLCGLFLTQAHCSKFMFSPKHAFLLKHTLECLPMAQETWVQSQVESYQRLKKWYLMLPCLTLNIIRYRSKVKWSYPGKGVAPSLTP